jgi:hypothetical protein
MSADKLGPQTVVSWRPWVSVPPDRAVMMLDQYAVLYKAEWNKNARQWRFVELYNQLVIYDYEEEDFTPVLWAEFIEVPQKTIDEFVKNGV